MKWYVVKGPDKCPRLSFLKSLYWICYNIASVLCVGFLAVRHVGGILAPRPGIEPTPPCTGRWSLNHWTAWKVPQILSWKSKWPLKCRATGDGLLEMVRIELDLVEWGRFGYKVESWKDFLEDRIRWTNLGSDSVDGLLEHKEKIGQWVLNYGTIKNKREDY